ncbi:zf-TFIIB domain-containing protein [Candidatus Gottesmanbacteria bacterium]|nr:zf-TFIIB domain-containing protein [Candidatus Gottesmanbacteria bacterium]
MRCPNDDADLIEQKKTRRGLTISYATCPTCHGHWLDAFNANYLKTEDIERSQAAFEIETKPNHPVCPTCQEQLRIYHGENIPPDTRVWRCPNNHGYFFPQAQLFAFKKAQEAKLSYFKLWNIPLPQVSSVLLASIALIVTIGLVTTYLYGQQTTLLEARHIVQYQEAFVSHQSANIVLTTSSPTEVTLHIGEYEQVMQTKDNLLHTLFLTNLASGTYEYYVTFPVAGKIIRSDPYTFFVP